MRTRVVSILIVLPFGLLFICWPDSNGLFPGWLLSLLVLGIMAQALREFFDGCRTARLAPLDAAGYAGAVLFWLCSLPSLRTRPDLLSGGLALLFAASFVWETLRPERAPLRNLAPTWFGALYLGTLFPSVVRLRCEAGEFATQFGWVAPAPWMGTIGLGACLVLFTLLITSATDTGAYVAGKRFGRRKLAPALSPGKTWEGSIGGFVAALLVGGLAGWWFGLPTPYVLVASLLGGVVSQLGDLCKSAVKREIGIKDFGTLLPGHGGLLDRFDSLMFTATLTYWLARAWG